MQAQEEIKRKNSEASEKDWDRCTDSSFGAEGRTPGIAELTYICTLGMAAIVLDNKFGKQNESKAHVFCDYSFNFHQLDV